MVGPKSHADCASSPHGIENLPRGLVTPLSGRRVCEQRRNWSKKLLDSTRRPSVGRERSKNARHIPEIKEKT